MDWMEERTDGQTEGRTHGCMDGQMDGQVVGYMGRWTDGPTNKLKFSPFYMTFFPTGDVVLLPPKKTKEIVFFAPVIKEFI